MMPEGAPWPHPPVLTHLEALRLGEVTDLVLERARGRSGNAKRRKSR